jgi:hypothetical protein
VSGLGDKVQAEVMSRLEGLIAEEELAAMVDAAIPRVRQKLQDKVDSHAQGVFESRLKPFFDQYTDTDAFDSHAQDMADKLVERLFQAYLQEAREKDEGKKSSFSSGGSYGSKTHKLVEVVEQGFVEKVLGKVREKIEHWRHSDKLDKQADELVEKMFPRVAAAWLETGAIRMFNILTGALSQGREVVVNAGGGGVHADCPSCATQIRSCPKCASLRRAGEYCCGEMVGY